MLENYVENGGRRYVCMYVEFFYTDETRQFHLLFVFFCLYVALQSLYVVSLRRG